MEEAAEVCFINIGPRQRRRRLLAGVTMLAIGVGIAVALVVGEAPRLSRLWLLIPFFGAGMGFFQWREKT